jgi:hypothetical protein
MIPAPEEGGAAARQAKTAKTATRVEMARRARDDLAIGNLLVETWDPLYLGALGGKVGFSLRDRRTTNCLS